MAFLEEKLTERLERERFVKWLKSGGHAVPVGIAQNPNSCPIACYLRSYCGSSYIHVGAFAVRVGLVSVPTPEWVARFVDLVDEEVNGTPITKAKALGILDSIKERADV